jgi:beta-galactosidase
VVIKDAIGKSGVVQIPINIIDKEGNTVYAADNEITVSIKGNAVLLGLESGSSTSHEDYKSNNRKALHGKMIAYVLVENNAGNTTIEFSSPGLQSQTSPL